ncbi:hypothetical protein ACHAW5_010286 [Stephanodiscus triporus]|uniref:Uncharacterized protein n=1 Tax=Stephanodiscus triporus TaxID=2934178 RepID=A0ABD3NZQ2_9STRA
MAAAEPDFLALVETNRFQPAATTGATSTNAHAQLQQQRKAYWKELITLRLAPPAVCTVLNIPRFRLTENLLREVVNRGSSRMLLVSHLRDANKTVISPTTKDLQTQCQKSPVVYDVIVHFAGGVERGGVLSGVGDSYYRGDMIYLIKNLPKFSKSEKYAVSTKDVHQWLINGAIDEIESVRMLSANVSTMQQTLQQLEIDINSIHLKPIYNEQGRAIVGSQLHDAREVRFKSLQDEKKQSQRRLLEAEQSLESERARHFSACPLLISQRGLDAATGNVSFSVNLLAEGKTRDYYSDLISKKTDFWSAPMYATLDMMADCKQKSNMPIKNVGTTDRTEHLVDVGSVSVIMLPDGFGVHEAFVTSAKHDEDGGARSHHRIFHGHLRDGAYHEGTLHSDSGVYSGAFRSNEPCGQGKMKYIDAIILTGGFALSIAEDDSPLGPNPYLRGSPHGDVKIQYRCGASYEGEMRLGRVTGNGIYRYPSDEVIKENKRNDLMMSFVEIKGQYVDGMLQNHDNDNKGRGPSNLLMSFMFGGKRFWGP